MTQQPSGIFLVNKPKEMTTNQLIQTIKTKLKVNKIGHAGTLDPLATGVVVVLVNQGTKLSDLFLNQTKTYQVGAKLYEHTTTYDSEGEVVKTDLNHTVKNIDQLQQVVEKYNGLVYEQTPPIYSAIKVQGKELYKYARNHEVDVLISPRTVEIYQSRIDEFIQEPDNIFYLTTIVSKGTYIRSLVVDIATDLNTYAHVVMLNRLQSGVFHLDETKTLDELTWADLIPNYEAVKLSGWTIHELNETEFYQVENGRKITLPLTLDRVFLSYQHHLVALYAREESGQYKSIKGGFNH